MNTKIKNAIIGLALGLFAVGSVNAYTCLQVKGLMNNSYSHFLKYRNDDPKTAVTEVYAWTKAQGFNATEQKIFVGAGMYLDIAAREDSSISDAKDVAMKACEDGGAGWIMTQFYNKADAYMEENNIE